MRFLTCAVRKEGEGAMAVRLARARQLFTSTKNVRRISSCTTLSGRSVGSSFRRLGMEEEELENLSPDDFQALTNNNLSKMKDHISKLDVDVGRYQTHLRYKTLEHKYFKTFIPKEENLLTWSMKEQLRYLHSTDPGTWTPDVLSKSFPISPTGIKKLLKAKWMPKNEAALQKHDRNVAARWKQRMKGQLGSSRLIEAYLKNYCKETSPVLAANAEQTYTSLENLKFDMDEEIHTPKGLRPKNKLPDTSNFKGKFSKILSSYEEQLSQINKLTTDQADQNQAITKAADLSTFTACPPTYQGSYTKVSPHSHGQRPRDRNRKSKGAKKIMTINEFLAQRS